MNFDYYLSWGKYFSEDLTKSNNNRNYINLGYPINYISNSTNKNSLLFLAQGVDGVISENDFLLFIDIACTLGSKYINNKEIFVNIRPHPNIKLSFNIIKKLKDCNVNILDNQQSLIQQLSNSIIAVGITTSSLVEAIYCNVIPVCINTTSYNGYHMPLDKLGLGMIIDNFEDSIDFISELVENKTERNKYLIKILEDKNLYFENNKNKLIFKDIFK